MLSGNQLLLAIFVGLVGFIFGALLAVLLTGRGRQVKAEEKQDPEKRHNGEVRVWHEGALSRLVTEIDGQTFSNSKSLSEEQRQKLIRLLRDWAAWLEVVPQAGQAARPAAPAAAAPAQAETPRPAAAPQPSAPQAAPAKAEAAVKPAPAVAPKPPADGKQPAAPASIVSQINDILQEMLEESDMKAKGIRLVEDARNGVTVWVGLHHYNSIDSVTDPEALAMVRAAVAEWERRAEKAA